MNFAGLLGFIFVLAKAFGVEPIASWSWWLVLLPFYGGLVVWLLFVFGVVVLTVLVD